MRDDRPEVVPDEIGCSRMASVIEQKMIPRSANFSRKVVATETLSNTASTATPEELLLFERNSSRSNVRLTSGSI